MIDGDEISTNLKTNLTLVFKLFESKVWHASHATKLCKTSHESFLFWSQVLHILLSMFYSR